MTRILVVLQNPYDKGKLSTWNPSTWRQEFERSRAGVRLRREALPSGGAIKYSFANANPTIGNGARSRFAASPKHIRKALRRVQPDLVLACGRDAEDAIAQTWDGPMIAIPHPSYMCLTNELLRTCRVVLVAWVEAPARALRIALRQRRGSVEVVPR